MTRTVTSLSRFATWMMMLPKLTPRISVLIIDQVHALGHAYTCVSSFSCVARGSFFFSQRKQALYTDLYSYRRPSESRRRRRLVVDLALMYLPPACFRFSPAIYTKVTDEFIQISIDPLHAPTRSIFFWAYMWWLCGLMDK